MQKYICISRPRRFGKSIAANMLTAYYSCGCDARQLFAGLEIIRELKAVYPDVDYFDTTDLIECMQDIYAQKKQTFVVIIDEWDCIFREYKEDKEAQEKYMDFLRDLLKDKSYIHLAYMTGILPIKKYGTHSASDWGEVSKSLKNSAETLEAIWQNRPEQVAEAIRQAHFETSHIQYNDENALSYTISLALYAARNFYTVHRELAGGKGFADMVFLPRKKFPEKPALIVELKWNKSAEGAIAQIKNKEYCKSLEEYQGNLLLVGVNYNRKTKEHECMIEKMQM